MSQLFSHDHLVGEAPAILEVWLRMTAHRKNWIDTADLDDLKTTPHGRNFVEHDLPRKKAEG